MGWFNSVLNFGKKVIGTTGSVLKRVGEFGSKVGHVVGSWAPFVSNIIGTGVTGAGLLLGQPEIAVLGEGIKSAGEFVGSLGHKTNEASKNISNTGNTLSDLFKDD